MESLKKLELLFFAGVGGVAVALVMIIVTGYLDYQNGHKPPTHELSAPALGGGR